MEAPGLDLGGSGLDFRRFWTSQTMPEGFSWVANALPPTCPASLGRLRAKSDRDVAKSQDVCLECLCFRVLAAMGEVLTEWGGRRCPPPGGFQWNWSQVGHFGIQRLLGSWQFAETVPSRRTPASGWAFPGLARFRPHFSSYNIRYYR